MADFSFNLVTYIVIALLTAISEYFTRIVQKYEDKKDDTKLNTLPMISHNLSIIIKLLERYRGAIDFDDFQNKIDNVIKVLDEKISSGNIIFSKIDNDKIIQYYWDLQLFNQNLKDMKGSNERKEDLTNAIKYGNKKHSTWLKVNPLSILKSGNELISEIEDELNQYKLWGRKIILLIIIIGIIIGLTNFLNQFL